VGHEEGKNFIQVHACLVHFLAGLGVEADHFAICGTGEDALIEGTPDDVGELVVA